MRMPCKNTSCTRKVYQRNAYGVCPRCLEVIQTVEWMLRTQILSAKAPAKTQAEELGLVLPGGK